MSKLIIYFSLSNNTKRAALAVQKITGADIVRIEPKTPYPAEYSNYSKIGMNELEEGILPEISTNITNFDQYETIFLGYPTWDGQLPMIFHSLAKKYDFTGKKIIPFTTTGGSTASESLPSVRKVFATSEVSDNFRYRDSNEQLQEFLRKNDN